MDFKAFGKEGAPTLMLIPGLGVSYEIFLPLVDLLKDKYRIIAVQVDGFTLGVQTEFWRWVFHSHYFDVLLDECRKIYPYGGGRAVLDGYKSVYTNKLESIHGADIHYWHGSLESFVAKPQVEYLKKLYPNVQVEVFPKMNHGQLLVDHPEEVARRIEKIS